MGFENCEAGFGEKRAGKWDWYYPYRTLLHNPENFAYGKTQGIVVARHRHT